MDANSALSPSSTQMDKDSTGIMSYIHKATHVILQSRKLLENTKNNDLKDETKINNDNDKTLIDNNLQLHILNNNTLTAEMNDKYLSHWNPRQSSLTFTIDISIQFTNETDNDLSNKSELIEQWKIVFNHGMLNENKNKKKKKPVDVQEQLKHQMVMQLRSLCSYIQLLPVQNILTPSNVINTMDLFNIGINVESDQELINDANNVPFRLIYRLSSAYEQAVSFSDNKTESKLQKKINTDSNIEIARFHNYDEIDYYLFPLLQFAEIGSLQLSVFYIDNDKFKHKFIENNTKLLQFISANNAKKKLNNKYLKLKVNEYIEEKQQQQVVLNAIEENKNIDINDEKEALYVDENEYENDKLLDDENKPLLPIVTVINNNEHQQHEQNDNKSKPGKMSKFLDKFKINVPRPCDLCIQILTHNIVKIGWKSDTSLKAYNAETNYNTKQFKFEIRCRKVVPKHESDEIINDMTEIIANRRIILRETFCEYMIYKDLECGNIYKFQVRIIDNKNNTFVSKWSNTLSLVIPTSDINQSKYDTIDDSYDENITMPKDHREIIEGLKLEEVKDLCSQLLTKVMCQQDRINIYKQKHDEFEDKLHILEHQKDMLMKNLNTVQRNLRIKNNQYSELDIVVEDNWNIDEKEGEEQISLRRNMPGLQSLLREWNDLKMDVHLKLWVSLCDELIECYGNDPNKRSMIAFEVLFDIVMHCYKQMMYQQQILGVDDDNKNEKEIGSHDILVNMDICFGFLMDDNSTADDNENVNDNKKIIYAKFCHRIVDTVIFNALRDEKSKWFKFNLFQNKEIQFALNDYVCECCRIIWCLLCLSKDNYRYILYPTFFRQREKQYSRRKMKMIDMEFGMDTYDNFEDIEMDSNNIIVENDKSIEINKMENYNEKIHKKEMGSANNEKHIEYCSWPSVVKISASVAQASSGSSLFGRLSNSDINSKEDDYQFLTRAFVFCCL